MADTMKVQPIEVLLTWMLTEWEHNGSIFGIPRSLFYTPRVDAPYVTAGLFGQTLATPIGPAAGPHTQLAQNIVCSWLCGGRFIELKTAQIMDELEIPRPCIDVEDEGYNVEWSQELKLEQSAAEYIKAWVLIHVLHRFLGFEPLPIGTPYPLLVAGTIFNLSVGYNLEGIRKPPMQRFMNRLRDASGEIADLQGILAQRFPAFADLEVPGQITNSVTLSTMHGCPPDEIESIARYLLGECGLHTLVKLNPTLLGQDTVMHILHHDLGYHDIHIPDAVFDHDLKYDRAVKLIQSLQKTAAGRGLFFGVKLSNTLAMANHRNVLPGNEMYMSGRALYPITIHLFHKLAHEFNGNLNVSYAGGADALNLTTLLSCGALPVTAASDLLKPGGYGRFQQWLEELQRGMRARGAASLQELGRDRLANLEAAAAQSLQDTRYKKSYYAGELPRVDSALGRFDCIAAPCAAQCAVCQDVPEYAWLIGQVKDDEALQVILKRNPLPGITGYMCTHLCQTRCTRNSYDQPVAIRALKRFAVEHGRTVPRGGTTGRALTSSPAPKVAIIGSGPAGLSAAYFLALNGVRSTIFEARGMAGGMPAIAPHFRIPPEVVATDVRRITSLGVEIKLNHPVKDRPAGLLAQGFDAVYVATGFQQDAGLDIEGMDGKGVFTSLRFLEMVARGDRPALGSKVLVIGGGNTAMDATRTAQRLTGQPATIVYRRSLAEMPAGEEELAWLFEEGNRLIELVSPRRAILENGHVVALECVRNQLREPGPDGRRQPVEIPGSTFRLEADSIILAIGQKPDVKFLDAGGLTFRKDGAIVTDEQSRRTAAERVYAGGDVTRGPAIIIQACEDGRRAAQAICAQLGIPFALSEAPLPELSADEVLQVKQARTRKAAQHAPEMLPMAQRAGMDCVERTLSEADARSEAQRCLQCSTLCDKCVEVCPNRANYSFQVEPVRWSLPRLACRDDKLVVTGQEVFAIEQTRQIVHVDDFCNECGNCATFCVHQGKPYADKPRLFLDRSGFLQEDDNAFHVEGRTIRRREGGRESSLTAVQEGWTFENEQVQLALSPDWQVGKAVLKKPFAGTLSLQGAAEMAVILQGMGSVPFLLGVR